MDPYQLGSSTPDDLVKAMQPDTTELASQLIALLSTTVMCALFGIKTYNVELKYLTYSRWLVLALYLNSWAFTYTAIILASTNNGTYALFTLYKQKLIKYLSQETTSHVYFLN